MRIFTTYTCGDHFHPVEVVATDVNGRTHLDYRVGPKCPTEQEAVLLAQAAVAFQGGTYLPTEIAYGTLERLTQPAN